MLSKEEREAIRARCEAATPGEWRLGIANLLIDGNGRALFFGEGGKPNAEFIAHARQDIPALLDALEGADKEVEKALKTCPSGGNDGYITPRPCQLIECESCHSEHEAITDGIKDDRDHWKARAEALEKAILSADDNEVAVCQSCLRYADEMTARCQDCINRNFELWQFDESRFAETEESQ